MTAASRGARAAYSEDTIVAIITPPGEGGIAALRLAGPKSLAIFQNHFKARHDAAPLEPFVMRYGHAVDRDGGMIDEILAVFMPQGRSYTGLDQVEIFCHGGRQAVSLIMEQFINSGARPAEPGEFTRLAFLNGRIDLTRAEAVAELIAANTAQSYRVSREHLLGAYSEHIEKLRGELVSILAEVESGIDFSEEDIDPAESAKLVERISALAGSIKTLLDSYIGGRIIHEGFHVAIAGRPNAGKSSLFNLLLRQERALVTPTAGTTRDYLSEWIDLGGYAVELIDTAGLRKGGGAIEKAGQRRSSDILKRVDLLLWIFDISQRGWESRLTQDQSTHPAKSRMLVANKIDLIKKTTVPQYVNDDMVAAISCVKRTGIDALKEEILRQIAVRMPDLTSGLVVTSARHQQKLKSALKGLTAARRRLSAGEGTELAAFELHQAVDFLDEITGRIYTEEILGAIFAQFCVGK